jgi:hypothetical protein
MRNFRSARVALCADQPLFRVVHVLVRVAIVMFRLFCMEKTIPSVISAELETSQAYFCVL